MAVEEELRLNSQAIADGGNEKKLPVWIKLLVEGTTVAIVAIIYFVYWS